MELAVQKQPAEVKTLKFMHYKLLSVKVVANKGCWAKRFVDLMSLILNFINSNE